MLRGAVADGFHHATALVAEALVSGAEVDEHGAAAAVEEDVVRLDVEVKDAEGVEVIEGIEYADHEAVELILGDAGFVVVVSLGEVAEALAVHILRDVVEGVVGLEEGEYFDDVVVVEAGEEVSLAQEVAARPLEGGGGGGVLQLNVEGACAALADVVGEVLFDDDAAAQQLIIREVGDTEAAGAHTAAEAVAVEDVPLRQFFGSGARCGLRCFGGREGGVRHVGKAVQDVIQKTALHRCL